MLDKIIGALEGFFSRAFWFGSFLPVAIVAAAHLIIAWRQYPQLVPLNEWVTAKFESLALFPAAFAGLVVLAYALTPLIPLLRGVLDGSSLPGWLYDWLRREHVITMRAKSGEITEALETAAGYVRLVNEAIPRLQVARAAGIDAAAAAAANPIPHPERIISADNAIKTLQKQIEAGATPAVADVRSAVDQLEAALNVNTSVLPAGDAQKPHADRLAIAHRLLVTLLPIARDEAQHRFETATARNRILLTIKNPQATRMADARRMIENYSFDVYQADFDYIWPRLQLVLPKEGSAEGKGSFGELLVSARSQVDFAILSLALVLTIPAVWLPLLAFTASSPWLFVAIGIATPFLALFFYELAVQSQIALGEVVKAAIDKHRFDLLRDVLRQPLPTTLSAERDLWRRLRRAEEGFGLSELTYRHSPDTARVG